MTGWLPAYIRFDGSEPLVEWIQSDGDVLGDPLAQREIAQTSRTGTLAAMIALSRRETLERLAGMVLQISRCGSTLVANALGASPGAVVFHEPAAISGIFKLPHEVCAPALVRDAVRATLQAFERYATLHDVRYVVKFESWNIIEAGLIRSLVPGVPTLVLVRDPLEVAVSVVQTPPGWALFKTYPALGARILPWESSEIAAMTSEEFISRTLGLFLAAAAAEGGRGAATCDYSELTTARIREIASHFGLRDPADESLDRIMRFHSKSGTQAFTSDSEQKKASATATMREAIAKYAYPHYRAVLDGRR